MTDCICTDAAILCGDHREELGLADASSRGSRHYLMKKGGPMACGDLEDVVSTHTVSGTSCRDCLSSLGLC